MPDDDRYQELAFKAQRYALRKFLSGIPEILEDVIPFIPLPAALKDKYLGVIKLVLPQVLALFPNNPPISDIGILGPPYDDWLAVLELYWSRQPLDALNRAATNAIGFFAWLQRGSILSDWRTLQLFSPMIHFDP